MGNRLLFPAGASSYRAEDLTGLFWVPASLGDEGRERESGKGRGKEGLPSVDSIKKKLEQLRNEQGEGECVRNEAWIPCQYLPALSTSVGLSTTQKYVVIYLHGNSCDLGDMNEELNIIRRESGFHVVQFEFPGYGICQPQLQQSPPSSGAAAGGGGGPAGGTGTGPVVAAAASAAKSIASTGSNLFKSVTGLGVGASARGNGGGVAGGDGSLVGLGSGSGRGGEDGGEGEGSVCDAAVIDKWAMAVALFLLSVCREDISTGNLIIMGRSIGTGPAARLARRLNESLGPVGGLVLHSPYTSIHDVLSDYVWKFAAFVIQNYWDTRDELAKMAPTKTPLLIVHGAADEIIPVKHSKDLFDGYKVSEAYKMAIYPQFSDHNSYSVTSDLVNPLRIFALHMVKKPLKPGQPSLLPSWTLNLPVPAPNRPRPGAAQRAPTVEPRAVTAVDAPATSLINKVLCCDCGSPQIDSQEDTTALHTHTHTHKHT